MNFFYALGEWLFRNGIASSETRAAIRTASTIVRAKEKVHRSLGRNISYSSKDDIRIGLRNNTLASKHFKPGFSIMSISSDATIGRSRDYAIYVLHHKSRDYDINTTALSRKQIYDYIFKMRDSDYPRDFDNLINNGIFELYSLRSRAIGIYGKAMSLQQFKTFLLDEVSMMRGDISNRSLGSINLDRPQVYPLYKRLRYFANVGVY